ncbi:hypothetical protein PIROE2DRAFT_5286 [Piromyces sp. E2]|nr:hypothetical protein PIROE2DRAFT_5286 [Piromyces sp. E2]|eukprot:OUM67316.1 hypothetical protein PIROE2DRAFT_5286 [Piromyces sp. E2]
MTELVCIKNFNSGKQIIMLEWNNKIHDNSSSDESSKIVSNTFKGIKLEKNRIIISISK